MAIIDSVKLPDNSTYDLTDNYSGYQKETLATPLNINGDTKTTVEGALDGINAYVDDTVEAAFDVYGAKNLFPYPYDNTTKTENGITFTDNGDGTVTVGDVSSQTATGNAFFYEIQTKIVKIPAGTYKITGCPSGGNINTYYLRVVAYDVSTGTQVTYSDDYGSGATITISNGIRINAVITVKSGTTIAAGGITFSPMIRNNLVKDETFTTGAKTNLQLTQDKAERTDLTTIFATGNKNTTGAQIAAGTFFYLNGVYCKALTNIAVNATFTENTNYKKDTVGANVTALNGRINGSVKQYANTNTLLSDVGLPIESRTTQQFVNAIPKGIYMCPIVNTGSDPTDIPSNYGVFVIFKSGTTADQIAAIFIAINSKLHSFSSYSGAWTTWT